MSYCELGVGWVGGWVVEEGEGGCHDEDVETEVLHEARGAVGGGWVGGWVEEMVS